MTTTTPAFHQSGSFRFALALASLFTFTNFVLMFRGWVVAPQAEIVGANILFFFPWVVPWIGVIASGMGKLIGPWILTLCPVVALTGFFFTNNSEWDRAVLVILITAAPALAIGLRLLTLSRREMSR